MNKIESEKKQKLNKLKDATGEEITKMEEKYKQDIKNKQNEI